MDALGSVQQLHRATKRLLVSGRKEATGCREAIGKGQRFIFAAAIMKIFSEKEIRYSIRPFVDMHSETRGDFR